MRISHYAAEHCHKLLLERIKTEIPQSVQLALKNTHPAHFMPAEGCGKAVIVCGEEGIFCGKAWVEEIFRQLDTGIRIQWQTDDSAAIQPGQTLATVTGPAGALLMAESIVLNFLQTLSGTATQINRCALPLAGGTTRLIDSLGSTPGTNSLKYALLTGTTQSQCLDFSDMIPLKQNHIVASGSVRQAIENARWIDPDRPVEIEVNSQQQLTEAISAEANFILLNNFSASELADAITTARESVVQPHLEAGGDISPADVENLSQTGIDYIHADTLIRNRSPLSISFQLLPPAE